VYLGTLSVDVHLHDTYFVVAHFHYVMVGGTVVAFLGGLFHWWPKMVGRMYNETLGKASALLVFVGFNVTFLTQFFLGHQGMPRRYYAYLPEYETLHRVSTIGSYILGVGLLVVLIALLHALKSGKRAGPNPWDAVSLEWHTASPPIEHNFHEIPHVTGSPYDFPEIDGDGDHH
jgi:cytochrome c oxidase subunit 1